MSLEPPDPSLPGRLREFHGRLPLAGDPPNALLALPDDRLLYLAALLRDTPTPPPALTLHGVFPLLAYRLRAWPEDCRPPGNGLPEPRLPLRGREDDAGRPANSIILRRVVLS